jgi:CRISPR/Cas system-associated exonuclease Cas4 (RecB family)
MATTIQISEDLQAMLCKRKLYERQTYEEVIYDLVEDSMEINEETKKELAEARADAKAGRVKPLSAIKKELGL